MNYLIALIVGAALDNAEPTKLRKRLQMGERKRNRCRSKTATKSAKRNRKQ